MTLPQSRRVQREKGWKRTEEGIQKIVAAMWMNYGRDKVSQGLVEKPKNPHHRREDSRGRSEGSSRAGLGGSSKYVEG